MFEFKYILKYLKYCKKDFIITFLLIVVETVFELIIPFLMKDIINVGIENQDINQIINSGILIIICAIISLITGYFFSKFNAKYMTSFSYHLREDIFKKIQEYSFSNLDKFQASSLVTRITNDVTIMQHTLGTLRPLSRSPLMLGMGIGLSFAIAPQLAWIFLAFVPFLAVILFLIVRKVAPQYTVLQENVDNVNNVVRENVVAIRTVKSYVRESYEEEKFNDANLKVMNTTKKTFRIAQLNQPSLQLVMYTVTVLLLSLGAIAVHNNEILVGDLSAMLSYVLQVVNSLMMVSNVFLMVNRSFASSKRIYEVLNEKIDITSKDEAIEKISRGDIEFKNVSFKYNLESEEYVLNDINLEIKAGQSIGILGSTGAAKSTLVSLILRLYDVTAGEVLIDGINVKDYDLTVLRDNISIVLQNNVLFSGTILENLKWGNPNATAEEIKKYCDIACASEFIERLPNGLYYDLGQGGVNVSGGQKQRLCIARALLKEPKILIFDDSTSACDMETERTIMQGIKSLTGMTSIIIGQRLTSVMQCNKIIILDEGKIVNIGTHEELLEVSPIYKDLYRVQLGGEKHGNSSI